MAEEENENSPVIKVYKTGGDRTETYSRSIPMGHVNGVDPYDGGYRALFHFHAHAWMIRWLRCYLTGWGLGCLGRMLLGHTSPEVYHMILVGQLNWLETFICAILAGEGGCSVGDCTHHDRRRGLMAAVQHIGS